MTETEGRENLDFKIWRNTALFWWWKYKLSKKSKQKKKLLANFSKDKIDILGMVHHKIIRWITTSAAINANNSEIGRLGLLLSNTLP